LGSALLAIAGALFFGVGFGRVMQLVHVRAGCSSCRPPGPTTGATGWFWSVARPRDLLAPGRQPLL
jgi:hypothetical protein